MSGYRLGQLAGRWMRKAPSPSRPNLTSVEMYRFAYDDPVSPHFLVYAYCNAHEFRPGVFQSYREGGFIRLADSARTTGFIYCRGGEVRKWRVLCPDGRAAIYIRFATRVGGDGGPRSYNSKVRFRGDQAFDVWLWEEGKRHLRDEPKRFARADADGSLDSLLPGSYFGRMGL
jgi:hypothetical protein